MRKGLLLVVVLIIAVGVAFFFQPNYFSPLLDHFTKQNTSPISMSKTIETPIATNIENKATPDTTPQTAVGGIDLTVDGSGLSKAVVTLSTSKGLVKYKFYSNDAPKTIQRMIELIQKGFYDGLTFHRVIAGFVAQGGDPRGDGTGGSGQKLLAEFNSRPHVEGTVAMARSPGDINSADSQFYISLGAHPHLDKEYTVFGQVIEGMDIVQKIQKGDKINSVTIQ